MVTKALQLQASDKITGSLRAVDYASLVLVANVMCELCKFFGESTECERTIVLLEAFPHLLREPTSVKYVTQQSNPYVLIAREP